MAQQNAEHARDRESGPAIWGAFLTNVEGEIERGHISEELISAGERAVNGQRTASVALIQVIDKMP